MEIVDILRDKAVPESKHEAEASVVRKGNKLVIEAFYPLNPMQKLSIDKGSCRGLEAARGERYDRL